MGDRVKDKSIETKTARLRLPSGRQPHWKGIVPGRVALGYQKWRGEAGRWVMRRWIADNKYRITTLGRADDKEEADGVAVLDYAQALAKLHASLGESRANKIKNITVRKAMELYIADKKLNAQPTADIESRGTAHILPELGDLVIAELETQTLKQWLYNLAHSPAQNRPKRNKKTGKIELSFRPDPDDDEAKRKRRATANRVRTMLRAVLNFAHAQKHVTSKDAWDAKAFPALGDAEVARPRYLNVAEVARLLNACPPGFRELTRGALETGMRYAELGRLRVSDFNPDAGTIYVSKGKSKKFRNIHLTDDGIEFFKAQTAGKGSNELLFKNTGRIDRGLVENDKGQWKASEQRRLIIEACEAAKLEPVNFHQTRHTWASLSVMSGMPLMVVAKNLGHRDTRMVELFYGHLAPDYVKQSVREHGPKYGLPKSNVEALTPRRETKRASSGLKNARNR